ncbi:Pectin lyase fold/virulence factor [Penicillium cf. griseofulvum]|uniref:pectin lyase n=1 Tax=Penicillium cf. griseofulvum TaxID=2972120 RepID=A0A9W9N0I8_9EURO|nr:Pectin lyase fold/virulence factor [Penicillium cf. griseofulvum]KAJ5422355.1 Pectin lyase fold/virulence factor [Penicillium cf. griseofulvum]KAJ5428538.1 Pectin lyase fold/virulence factor [Penicillium cf. griseofulvum]
MKFSSILLFTAVAVANSPAKKANTISVTGSPPGFAYGVTGGGNAKPVYPTDVKHLIQLLGSDDPQVIIIAKTYDFIGTEGTTKGNICKAYGSFEDGCQSTIDIGKGCDGKPSEPYEWDTAGVTGISVHSDKTIIGVGNNGVLLGKGLRIVRASNIIVQNIMITNLNPKLVWGGDAITLSSTSRVWIDHVTTQYTGRVHYVFGQEANSHVTISNSFMNGATNFSTSCDGQQYWGLELVGADDQITFANNYVYRTSGRSPALSGKTLFHAVNSVWENNNGHAIEGTDDGQGLFEGCVFNNVSQIVGDYVGQLFSSPSATANKACAGALKRDCVTNIQTDSGVPFTNADTKFFSNFVGLNVATASAASKAQASVPTNAGNTLNNA